MLSKVLTAEAAEAEPIAWKRNFAIPSKPAKPVAEGAADEVLQLRARITEQAATAEQQARRAYEQGMRAGETAARKALEADTRAAIDRATASIAEVAAARAALLHRAETDTVRLALEIARRALHRELRADPHALAELVKAALAKLQSQDIQRARVHPDQENLVRASLEKAGRGTTIVVLPDASLAPGSILFEIARGSLDASLDTQLAEIERSLGEVIETRS